MDGALTPVSTIRANVDGMQPDEPASPLGCGKQPDEPTNLADGAVDRIDYFYRVARALDVADEILVVGPSATKQEFVKYMHKDDHAIDPRILGVETIDHPSDAMLVAFAKLYFTVGGPLRSGNGSRHNRTQ